MTEQAGPKMINAREFMEGFFIAAGRDETTASEEGAKAVAVEWLAARIRDANLTQSGFGEKIGWSQPIVSALLRGNLGDYSIDRLNKALAVFGGRIETAMRLHLPAPAPVCAPPRKLKQQPTLLLSKVKGAKTLDRSLVSGPKSARKSKAALRKPALA
jgi:predicted XRE-type DNA-binding protein